MFDYCVWYSIRKTHPLSKMVVALASKFNTNVFHAHITIASNLQYKEADHIYKHQCVITKPWFKIHGFVYQTKTVIGKHVFYALQQDYHMYDIPKLGSYHVSIAYRMNKPFNREEVQYANQVNTDVIWSHDIKSCLVDCRSTMPKNWHQLKINLI